MYIIFKTYYSIDEWVYFISYDYPNIEVITKVNLDPSVGPRGGILETPVVNLRA